MESYYHKSVEQTFKELNTSKEGLSEQEAKERLSKYGENKLKEAKKKSMFVRFLCQFKDIMVIILLVAAAISFVFAVTGGEGSELIDACIIFGIVILNAIFQSYQRWRTKTGSYIRTCPRRYRFA